MDIIEYIKSCQTQGYTQDQILSALNQAGWDQTQIDQAYSQIVTKQPQISDENMTALFNTAAQPDLVSSPSSTTPKRKLFKVGLITFLVILLLVIATGAMAEFGYWPAASEYLHKTTIPRLWSKTSGDKNLVLASVIDSTSQLSAYQVQSEIKLSINPSLSSMGTSALLPLMKQLVVASIQNQDFTKSIAATSEVRNLAAVSPDSAQNITVQGLFTAKKDQTGNFYGQLSIDLNSIRNSSPLLAQAFNSDATTAKAEIIIDVQNHQLYWRTNLLPSRSLESKDLWYVETVGSEQVTLTNPIYLDSQDIVKQYRELTAQQQSDLNLLINKGVKDRGMVRRDGEVLNWLQIDFSQSDFASLKAILGSKLGLPTEGNLSLSGELFLNSRSGVYRSGHLNLTSTSSATIEQYVLETNMSLQQSELPVTPPTAKQISGAGINQFVQLITTNPGAFYDTGIWSSSFYGAVFNSEQNLSTAADDALFFGELYGEGD